MVGTRGAAAAASSDGGSDRDAAGTSRAQSFSSSPAEAGGNDEKGGNRNIAQVSHDDVVSNAHKMAGKSGPFNLMSLRRTRLMRWRG